MKKGVYQVYTNKSPWVKIGPTLGGLHTDEQFQGHHGPLVYEKFEYVFLCKIIVN
jgi:hypothetical protein